MTGEIVRPAMEHIQRLCEIEKECFGPNAWSESSIRWSMEDPLQTWLCWQEDGVIYGYITVQIVCGLGYIGNVAVSTEKRRQGIAKALLTALREIAEEQQLEELTLEVRESNLPAIALYGGAGYTEVGRRPKYYETPREGAILMTKFFKGSDVL